MLSTLSRSGLLGLVVGLFVLALPYRRGSSRARCSCPLAGVAARARRRRRAAAATTSRCVLKSRFQTGGSSENAHFAVYYFVPQVLHSHPLFGLGLNTFSVYYEFVTGKSNWGPHSFYVALIVETGLVGTVAFFALPALSLPCACAPRGPGQALALGEPRRARVRPLAWGMTAALAGTMAANFFYLTMQFYYFYAFAVLVLALPIVFSRRRAA